MSKGERSPLGEFKYESRMSSSIFLTAARGKNEKMNREKSKIGEITIRAVAKFRNKNTSYFEKIEKEIISNARSKID